MAEERLGASFSIDITALKTGLTQANRLIRESNSEFKAAAAGLDDWSSSEDGLNAKLKNLNDVADIQAKKVEALQKEYDRCIADGLDPMSAAAIKMRTDLNNEKTALANTESEVKKYTDALSDLKAESGKTATAADKLRETVANQESKLKELKEAYINATLEQGKNSKEAKALKKQITELSGELDKNNELLGEASEAAEKAGDGFTVAKGAIANFVADGLTNLVSSCKNAISSIVNLSEETQEYREDMGKLATAWESAGLSTEWATETYKEFYSVLGEEDRSVEAVNHLAKLVDTQEDLQKWTDICAGVWGTFGDSLPIEGLTEASNETAKVGALTGVLADALNWAGVNEDDFQASLDQCSDESERAALITETLNDLYSEAADNYKENNKSVIEARKATSNYTDSIAILGEKIEPISTKVKEGFNQILGAVVELVEDVDFNAFSEKIDSAFRVLTEDVLPTVINGFIWIKDNSDTIIAGLAGIATAFLAFKVATIIQSVTTALQGMTIAQAALNAVMSINPFAWVAIAIGALVTAIVLLIQNWDAVAEAAVNAWDWIKETWGKASDWFSKNVITPVVDFFKDLWQTVSDFCIDLWDDIKSVWSKVANWFNDNVIKPITDFFEELWKTVSGYFTSLWNDIVKAYHTVIDPWIEILRRFLIIVQREINNVVFYFEEMWKKIAGFFKQLYTTVSGYFTSLWNDIKTVWSKVANWFNTNVIQPVTKTFTSLWNTLKDGASNAWKNIKSAFEKAANWFSTNIGTPIKNTFTSVWNTLTNGASNAWKGVKSVFSTVGTFFADTFSAAWKKVTNVFSVSGEIFVSIKDAIISAFKKVVNALIKGINSVVAVPFNGLNDVLDKLHDIEILGVQPFDWLDWRVSVPEIPYLAKGGVVKGATTAVIGEDGAEAVVPLEKNREWIKAVAEEMAKQQKGNVVVNQTNNYSQAHSRYELYKSKQQTAAAVRLALGV